MLQTSGFGDFEHIHISIDPISSRNPGYCFIDFKTRNTAERALASLRDSIRSHPIKVGPCRPKRRDGPGSSQARASFQRWGNWTGNGSSLRDTRNEFRQGPERASEHFEDISKHPAKRVYLGGLPKMLNQEANQRELQELLEDLKPGDSIPIIAVSPRKPSAWFMNSVPACTKFHEPSMEDSLKFQRSLCSVCQDILLATTCDASTSFVRATGQTYEVFKKAAETKCTICSVVWSLSRSHHHVWADSLGAWVPMGYRAEMYSDEDSPVVLTVSYTNPLKNEEAHARFNLIPTSDVRYQALLDFPALESTGRSNTAPTTGLRWLTHCLSSHQHCNEPRQSVQGWLPTRLLDIGDADDSNWRLCETSEDAISPPSASYMTLSYRWSSTPRIRLLFSNLARFRQGQPIADLPVLFRDAIYIARRFSMRYLWIDALCILQDSQEDWEREAARMQHVFSNTACTLAASGSESPDDSLFRDRDLDFIRPGKIQSSLFSDGPRSVYIYDAEYWDRQVSEGPLQTRGWALQERYLSPRALYFGKHQLLWECRMQHRCEAFPEGIPLHCSNKTRDPLLEYQSETDRVQEKGFSLKVFSHWNALVEEFSRCDLTQPSDKLHAFAGIAKLFEEITGDEYAAGLWKSSFALMLDWTVYDPKPRLSLDYRAPSWSWAFVDGPVRPNGISAQAESLVTLVKLGIQSRTTDRMSAVLDANAVLQARVIPATIQLVSMPFVTFQVDSSCFKVSVYPDTTEVELKEGHKVSYMPLKLDYRYSLDGEETPFIACLLLEEQEQSPERLDQYRRIGYFVLYKGDGLDINSLCTEAETREVEII
ncbi:hypothetical protein AK830_g2815 [Neonectria ditissima]|uniref:RRM domain-containing protein n=1 Tax=Neonectria ditissima TaxID=78410 RepID=A0A0N8H879_9HYPO|nr:hypothetical protein AK830_g2815 [Neonectria ditissima]